VLDQASTGEPVAITAPTVMEVVRGLQAGAADRSGMAAALAWFVGLLASGLMDVLSLDRTAAILAGRLRAMQSIPPTGARRTGVKPEQRVGWVFDIQIAACAWTHGHPIATENLRDFEALRDLIAKLYPDSSPLLVAPSPLA